MARGGSPGRARLALVVAALVCCACDSDEQQAALAQLSTPGAGLVLSDVSADAEVVGPGDTSRDVPETPSDGVADAQDSAADTPGDAAPDLGPDTEPDLVQDTAGDAPADAIADADLPVDTSADSAEPGPDDTSDASDAVDPQCVTAQDCTGVAPPCQQQACLDGVCTLVAAEGTCDDNDPCTTVDRCEQGLCQGTQPDACDDGDACTVDSCVPGTGCSHQPVSCEGTVDGCRLPVCDPTEGCQLVDAPSGTACFDGDLCTLDDTCIEGECVAGDPLECTPSAPCSDAACVEGSCVEGPVSGGECSDGDPCTEDDTCDAGTCAGTPIACTSEDDCQLAECVAGECVVTNRPAVACDDGDPCTEGDACADGACVGTPKSCSSTNPCVVAECVEGECTDPQPVEGECNDQDPCTIEDRCVDGTCSGAALTCDDDDGCTADSCVDGACIFSPIEGCIEPVCDGMSAGEPCDDGDDTTSGDLCLGGHCRGFALTRVPGSVVSGVEGLVIEAIDYHRGVWSAVFYTAEEDYSLGWALANVSVPTLPLVDLSTVGTTRFRGLRAGLVGSSTGALWRRVAGLWTTINAYNTALSGDGEIHDLWPLETRGLVEDSQDALGIDAIWVVGADGDAEYIEFCERTGILQASCERQSLDDLSPPSIPATVSGLGRCEDDGCDPLVVLGADVAANENLNFNDTFENDGGDEDPWERGLLANSPQRSTTHDSIGYGEGQFLVVGSGGYLNHRTADGDWSGPLSGFGSELFSRTFHGAWAGSGIVAVVATRRSNQGEQLDYELWTLPVTADATNFDNWRVHSLASGANIPDGGLYDVWGRSNGEVRAVGGGARPGSSQWLDGWIFVRQGNALTDGP